MVMRGDECCVTINHSCFWNISAMVADTVSSLLQNRLQLLKKTGSAAAERIENSAA
jgi:hypothetical protein